jgi:hypothetical protein
MWEKTLIVERNGVRELPRRVGNGERLSRKWLSVGAVLAALVVSGVLAVSGLVTLGQQDGLSLAGIGGAAQLAVIPLLLWLADRTVKLLTIKPSAVIRRGGGQPRPPLPQGKPQQLPHHHQPQRPQPNQGRR